MKILWWIKFLGRYPPLGNIQDVFLHSYIIDMSSTMDVLLMDVFSNRSVIMYCNYNGEWDWSALHFLFDSKTVIDDSTGDNTGQWQKKYMPVFNQFLLFKFVIECILGTINYWSIVANTSGEFFTVIKYLFNYILWK